MELRSDNLRFPAGDVAGPLKIMDAFARGTALVPSGYAVMRGTQVNYRSLAGEVYAARIVSFSESETHCTIDVDLPGCIEPMQLTDIEVRWHE